MPAVSFPDLTAELLQLHQIENRARLLREAEEDEQPNVYDRLAEACKQKIVILQELEFLARIELTKARLQFDVQNTTAPERVH